MEKPKASPTPEEERTLAVPDTNLVNLKLPAETPLRYRVTRKSRPNCPSRISHSATVQRHFLLGEQYPGEPGIGGEPPGESGEERRRQRGLQRCQPRRRVDQSKQNISIVYHGDEDSPIQEVAFGDLQLNLPEHRVRRVQQAVVRPSGQIEIRPIPLHLLFRPNQGYFRDESFQGQLRPGDKVIQDIDYLKVKYFRITNQGMSVSPSGGVTMDVHFLPQSNSEQIWVDQGTGVQNPAGNLDNFGGPNNAFEHWLPGRDYTINYSTGVISPSSGPFLPARGSRFRISKMTEPGHPWDSPGRGRIFSTASPWTPMEKSPTRLI